jgi:hypothetical protein
MYQLKPQTPIVETIPGYREPQKMTDDNEIESIYSENMEEESNENIESSYFLDTVNILIKSDEINESTKEIQVCIFKIVDHGTTPYILYLLEYNPDTNQYGFVKPQEQDIAIESTITQKLIIQYPFLSHEADETIGTLEDERLRGFTENDSKITGLYDTTSFITDILEENIENFIWATIYEILGSQKIYEIPVDPTVILHFTEINEKYGYDYYTLKKSESEYIRSPYTLYLCQKRTTEEVMAGAYENIKVDKDSSILLYPRINHEKLDRIFLFSSNLLHPGSLIENKEFIRFAVFVDEDPKISILYIDGPESENQSDLDHLYDGTLEKDYQIVTFIEGSQQFWSIRNPQLFIPIE